MSAEYVVPGYARNLDCDWLKNTSVTKHLQYNIRSNINNKKRVRTMRKNYAVSV